MAMEAWVAGNIAWSFAVGRYFGADNLTVKKTLVVTLSPPGVWEARKESI